MKRRVLVVDNTPVARRFVAKVLARYGQLAVEYHDSDTEALTAARRERVDLFIVDARLDGLGALELCRAIRSECPRALTVVLSARKGTRDEWVDAFIGRPFQPLKLSRIVDQIL